MSTTYRYFTLSVARLVIECTKTDRMGNKKNIQIVVGRLAGNETKGLSCNNYFLHKKKAIYYYYYYYSTITSPFDINSQNFTLT